MNMKPKSLSETLKELAVRLDRAELNFTEAEQAFSEQQTKFTEVKHRVAETKTCISKLLKEIRDLADKPIIHMGCQPSKIDLGSPVEVLGLTKRSQNCLRSCSLGTIREVLEYGELGLLKLPGFGRKSIKEVKAALAEEGFELQMESSTE